MGFDTQNIWRVSDINSNYKYVSHLFLWSRDDACLHLLPQFEQTANINSILHRKGERVFIILYILKVQAYENSCSRLDFKRLTALIIHLCPTFFTEYAE